VEGQTEEECFPLILNKIERRPLMGNAIVGIRETEGADAKFVGIGKKHLKQRT